MEKYYGQHGEDFLTNKIFSGKSTGVYVEIGCLDGIEFSNTYYFEKKGWKGLCIEAHNDFITALNKNRPQAKIVHCAVGEKDIEEVTFYANKIGSLSTLDKGEESRWKEHYKDFFFGFEEQKVKMRTLNSIFADTGTTDIDFISLDIEGYEVQALTGIDLKKYRPRLFIIEYKDEDHKGKVDEILLTAGYYFLSVIGCNLFYSTHPADKKIITATYRNISLVSIDTNGNEKINTISLRKNGMMKKVKDKLSAFKRMVKKRIP
jgi:FkbM family methyltransferase